MFTINDQLLADVVTTRQARSLVKGLDRLLEKLFLTDKSWQEKLRECLSESQQDLISELINQNNISASDPQAIAGLLSQIKDSINQLPEITIYAADDLPQALWTDIGQKIDSLLGTKVLILVKVEPKILGGVILIKDGQKYDYTLKTKLEKWFTGKQPHRFL